MLFLEDGWFFGEKEGILATDITRPSDGPEPKFLQDLPVALGQFICNPAPSTPPSPWGYLWGWKALTTLGHTWSGQ